MGSRLEVVVGTYEEFLLGYVIKKTETEHVVFTQSFATHAHTASVRSVAAAGRFLASGGADDKIIIHDLKTRTEIRVMMHHNGTVNSVAFTNSGTHLFTGSSDGSMTATRTGNWQMEKHWKKAHSGSSVDHIAIHPTDKLALTLGGDRILRTWNLIKGRHAFATNLSSKGVAQAISVVWSTTGDHFALVGLNHIDIWTVSDAGVKKKLNCASKCISLCWISEKCIIAGLESGDIQLFYLKSNTVKTFKAHEQRVKCLAYSDGCVYSASSSGHLKMWEYDVKEKSLTEKCVISTGCRITCICLNKLQDAKPEIIPDVTVVAAVDDKIKIEGKNKRPYVSITVSGDDDSEDESKKVKKAKQIVKKKKRKVDRAKTTA